MDGKWQRKERLLKDSIARCLSPSYSAVLEYGGNECSDRFDLVLICKDSNLYYFMVTLIVPGITWVGRI